MALSSIEYTADGVTQTFSLTFPYLSQDHVQVFVDGAEDAGFTWATGSTVTLSSIPANGAIVKISRTTPTTPLVDFVDGSNLTEDYLDTATRQSLYVAEESRDNFQSASVGGIPDGSIEPVKLSASFGSWVKSATAALARTALGVLGITGGTFTGNIQVPHQPYNDASWDGNNEVPTKDAVRDEIESVKASISGASTFLHVVDQKATGVPGGTKTGGITETRDLNTVVTNGISGASLGSNQITLPAGTYYIDAEVPTYSTGRTRVYLYNVTDAVNTIVSSSIYATTTQIQSPIVGKFTIAATKVFEIRHFGGAKASDGKGVESGDGNPEVYTNVRIWRDL